MKYRVTYWVPVLAFLLLSPNGWSQETATVEVPVREAPKTTAPAVGTPATTVIDDYVRRPDDSYRWSIVSRTDERDVESIVVDMTSQTWRSKEEVDRTEWRHWITCVVPKNLQHDTALMMIGGGSNRGRPPSGPDDTIKRIAKLTGSVVFELKMVPNQPLVFHNDGQQRSEDDLIGYTWDQYIKTGDSDWLARGPMVKSAVRAMDTVTALMASDEGGNRTVDKYVVAGGSKRGWTTWLTGAMDDRVVAVVPIVIDVLNIDTSMRHHFEAYGYWAPAIGDYVHHRIMERIGEPRLQEAYRLVDPYSYRHRLTIPKFIVNAAGDQFFLPDSSQFYFDDLEGPKYLRYVPNVGHGLKGSDAVETISAFYALQLAGRLPPEFSWALQKDGAFRVRTSTPPSKVRLWHATNPNARDFRIDTLGPKYKAQDIEAETDGQTYLANVPKPDQGWTAYFVELTYDVGLPVPIKMTTNVNVTPDRLPYAGKPRNLPSSLTVVCEVPSAAEAQKVVADVQQLVESGRIPLEDLTTKLLGSKCYFNWQPSADESRDEAKAMTAALAKLGCSKISYQLESGRGITP